LTVLIDENVVDRLSVETCIMFNRRTILILLALLVLASIVGCGGGTQTTVTPNAGGPGGGATGSAALTWDAPTTNVDGTPITALAGYKIYYGTKSGVYTGVIDAGSSTSFAFNNLAPGTYYFVVTAYDSLGTESDYSNEASKVIL
jgi:hypothetical protein